jgi:CRP-like cAMP-binding protein
MLKASSFRATHTSARRESDGHYIQNDILLALPSEEFDRLLPWLEFIRLQHHQIVQDAGETLRSAYFCNSGILSVVNIMPEGKSVEVAMIGHEGFSGVPLIAGFRTNHTRTVVQVEATAFRIPADHFRTALRELPALLHRVQRYAQIRAIQAVQLAACNRLHEVEERLVRWLLMSQDRLGSNTLPLTQDFLAQMLGTRRSSVSVAIGILRRASLIEYARGSATILDRQGLEEACCDCYSQLQRQIREWESQDD